MWRDVQSPAAGGGNRTEPTTYDRALVEQRATLTIGPPAEAQTERFSQSARAASRRDSGRPPRPNLALRNQLLAN
eukprot:COSAG06_NODE_6180_length_3063_cov_4.108300_2_plen_75_part_00